MCNGFIDYLNSMNNADSSNENALAESQVLNDYYDDIKIDRILGKYIYKRLNEEKKAIILTGHAGDGKTSILIQILNEFGYFDEGKKSLKENELYKDLLFYVKDMSELSEEKRKYALKNFLSYVNKGISSLLISNTGPLINTFQSILSKDEFEQLENDLLSGLDENDLEDIEVNVYGEKCTFLIVNMAKLDNTYLIKELLDKFVQEKLWKPCIQCECSYKCPIYFNYEICKKNKDRISNIIEKIYIYFQENESRLTVRQIVSHLSFAFTGNLTCKKIKSMYDEDVLFDYSFANLFFGYKGTKRIDKSLNIKAIKELDRVGFYKKTLDADYNLFVDEKYDMFDNRIIKILNDKIDRNQTNLSLANEEGIAIREAFRRYYIIFNELNIQEDYDRLIKDVLSEAFFIYDKYSKIKIHNSEKNSLKEIVFKALYKIYIGVYPPKGKDMLYLTLKQNLDEVQNVQLILGEINKNRIDIVQRKVRDKINETGETFKLYVRFGSCKDELYLKFQTIQYFMRINDGEIFTSFNPNFTVGINGIKASLLETYRYNLDIEDDVSGEIRLLIIKRDKEEIININVDENGQMQLY